MTTTILLHIGQSGQGMGYDPLQPLPVPVAVSETGHCRYVPGDTFLAETPDGQPTLLGFNSSATPNAGDLLLASEWRKGDLDAAVGKFPVFVEPDSTMSGLTVPVTEVRVLETAARP